ncbi:sorbosone dehydrogenase [Methylopila jiangsuensis]|uniref:Sorbosone dehydrogenase n=1 Tax=Methylopila jiangsuensis TaxID=586230 RepID=A0A9W6N3E2_9HYPH|nr:sorbosone dehydrogenase family protein [Methylopila jiangsuensis]MDR6286211.1 glucose/arabinose dehydrogenase [Methylopila jiangsuensis]GLK75972.1 sorbosone dehydrogenase [Methylopila jiangsuensis]
MTTTFKALLLSSACLGLVACGEQASVPIEKTYGPDPVLTAPRSSWIPTVSVPEAKGWPQGKAPTAANGFAVASFAEGLAHPRWLYLLPNGDVLVAESNAPPKDESAGQKGLMARAKDKVAGFFKARAGAGVDSPNKIVLLRDGDGDGRAETKTDFLTGLTSPFGMALVGDRLYIANADALVVVPYAEGDQKASAAPQKVVDLPGGPINHHWTKNVIASKDGAKLYVTVGSNSNVAENGMEHETNRAAILEVDPAAKTSRLFASGLRNPNGLAWNPEDGRLWTTVNERDEIGSDLVPDYMTSVQEGGFYGWPYSWFGQHVDERVQPQQPDLVKKAIRPDYALGPHTASLGLTFYEGDLLPAKYRNGAFVGQHGSWNRKPLSGYKVIFVPFSGGKPSGPPEDVLTGFVGEDVAWGRPVGVITDRTGALLVADDAGDTVWRVTPEGAKTAAN